MASVVSVDSEESMLASVVSEESMLASVESVVVVISGGYQWWVSVVVSGSFWTAF